MGEPTTVHSCSWVGHSLAVLKLCHEIPEPLVSGVLVPVHLLFDEAGKLLQVPCRELDRLFVQQHLACHAVQPGQPQIGLGTENRGERK